MGEFLRSWPDQSQRKTNGQRSDGRACDAPVEAEAITLNKRRVYLVKEKVSAAQHYKDLTNPIIEPGSLKVDALNVMEGYGVAMEFHRVGINIVDIRPPDAVFPFHFKDNFVTGIEPEDHVFPAQEDELLPNSVNTRAQ